MLGELAAAVFVQHAQKPSGFLAARMADDPSMAHEGAAHLARAKSLSPRVRETRYKDASDARGSYQNAFLGCLSSLKMRFCLAS